MKFSHFFIDRPILAGVISIVIFLMGVGAYIGLPIAQYPNIAPPMIYVSTKYMGASPEVVMNSVIAPIEQSVNGVEGMIYMQSQAGSDGSAQVVVTFETGTDIDMAQVRVQNRVSETLNRLPKEVRDSGVTVRKRSPDLLITINLFSPNGTRDKLYLTNYAITQMKDRDLFWSYVIFLTEVSSPFQQNPSAESHFPFKDRDEAPVNVTPPGVSAFRTIGASCVPSPENFTLTPLYVPFFQ